MSDERIDGWRWMPLSERHAESPTYHDVLFPEPTGPLAEALDAWIARVVRWVGHDDDFLKRVNILAGTTVLIYVPHGSGRIERRSHSNLLDVVDLVIHLLDGRIIDRERPFRDIKDDEESRDAIHELRRMLDEGRSLWQVGRLPDQSLGLLQRVNDATLERARRVLSSDAIAVAHLRKGWGELYQRESHPKHALDESVFALESAMRSIISPKNDRATLGTMIRDLRAKPEKWAVPIGTVEQFAQRLDDIWVSQPRHGVDDENDVVEVERPVAEAALHEAMTIVHWCNSGLFHQRRTSDSA